MKILLIGSGGREHALAWAIKQSPSCSTLFIAPGNAGTAHLATNVALNVADHAQVIDFAKKQEIDLVVIGPEAPLVSGLADACDAAGILVFGPSKAAAQLEGSKDYTKKLCDDMKIPTAAYQTFTDAAQAKDYLAKVGVPIVLKADGLAAGKGVIIAATMEEANQAVEDILGGKFGAAGASVVIEECLVGEEISFFALVDGNNALAFGSAQDHKRAYDGDQGPNTGGMGTYSPAPQFTQALEDQVMREMILPTVSGMKARGTPFKGVLFAGLMLTASGPKLLEYNVRFGDPETQVLMRRLDSDLVRLLIATAKGTLASEKVAMKPSAAVCVVMAAEGYPGDIQKGTIISGLDLASNVEGVEVFHAATKHVGETLQADGGRVLGVTAIGDQLKQARERAYQAVDAIDWKEGFCRRDIGHRAMTLAPEDAA